MLTVLVTGATGFFGRHLVPHLLDRGYRVLAVTRQGAPRIKGVQQIEIADLEDEIDWPRYVDGVDAVVHLAALAHATSSLPEEQYDKINHRATARLAKAADAAGARFVFMSSVAAQSGASSEEILTEDAIPHPTTPYGRSKLRAEQEIEATVRKYVIFRPTLTYGFGVRGNMGQLIRLATSRIPPPLGAIRNSRSLLAVENMCDAVGFVLRSDSALNQVLLLSDEEPISTAEIVALLRSGAGLSLAPLRVPPSILFGILAVLGRGDVPAKIGGQLVVSVARLRGLGFRWKISTPDGLRTLGTSYRNSPSEKGARTSSRTEIRHSLREVPIRKSEAKKIAQHVG